MTDILEPLQWRYATKKYDSTKKVSDADLNELLEAVRLSASSYGFQAWKMIVVTNPELRKKLREAAWNQPQITDASHLIVFAAHNSIDATYVEKFVHHIANVRSQPVENLKPMQEMMTGSVTRRSAEDMKAWLQKQVYIALGFLLTAAAHKRIDSTPMEGFDNAKFDEILGLEAEGLNSVVLCPIGYRSADDDLAQQKKVRHPLEQIVEWKK